MDRVMGEEARKRAQVHSTSLEGTIREASRTLLNTQWEAIDARIAAEVCRRGALPVGDLTEEEIARVAVEMTDGDAAGARSG